MILLAAMVVVVTVAIFFRYVVDASLSWYDEFASYLLVWLSFYGAVVASWRGRHISFETLAERLGPSARRGIAVISEALTVVFQAVLLGYGIVLVRAMGHETAVSIEAVRMWWIYSVMPVSGGLMLLIGLVRLVDAIRGETPGAARVSAGTSSE